MFPARCYLLSPEAESFILTTSASAAPRETGGILVGRWTDDCILIQHASGPGPNAMHSRSRFVRDGDFAQRFLEEVVAASSGQYDYVGEWHSHTAWFGPSPLDRLSMMHVARNPGYANAEPILGLCIRARNQQWRLRFFWQYADQLVEVQPCSQ